MVGTALVIGYEEIRKNVLTKGKIKLGEKKKMEGRKSN